MWRVGVRINSIAEELPLPSKMVASNTWSVERSVPIQRPNGEKFLNQQQQHRFAQNFGWARAILKTGGLALTDITLGEGNKAPYGVVVRHNDECTEKGNKILKGRGTDSTIFPELFCVIIKHSSLAGQYLLNN